MPGFTIVSRRCLTCESHTTIGFIDMLVTEPVAYAHQLRGIVQGTAKQGQEFRRRNLRHPRREFMRPAEKAVSQKLDLSLRIQIAVFVIRPDARDSCPE